MEIYVFMQSDCYFYLIRIKLPTSLTHFSKNTQYKITHTHKKTTQHELSCSMQINGQTDIKSSDFSQFYVRTTSNNILAHLL